jgi:ribulose-phosphate 3-epimerase
MATIVPAVLASSQEQFDTELSLFLSIPQVSRIQIDVVDGIFASPATWPDNTREKSADRAISTMLPALERVAYEIDLMGFNPIALAEQWVKRGATRLTFHYETSTRPEEMLREAREHFGSIISIGLALNIQTDLELVADLEEHIDYLQCMGIAHIGRQGEPFDRQSLTKVRLARLRYPRLPVQVDGGVSFATGRELIAAGASSLIGGSAILRASDPAAEYARLESIESPYGV